MSEAHVSRALSTVSAGEGGGVTGAVMERFVYDDAIVRKFLTATMVWGLVAFLVGLLIAVQLAWPAANLGFEYTSFGRLRPLHTNAAIFAFAGNAIFAAVYYSTQRLCKARMWSDRLSALHFWGWQAIIVSAALTLPLGITQGKEYAELEWPIDLAIAVVWLGFFGTNFFMTLVHRRERHMYVALWFYIATIVTVTVLHVFNSLVVPAGLFKSYSVYAGVQDAFMQWWYGHNAVAFFLTTPFLGLMYYFMPKAAGRPVFSYRLSILHFWSLVFIYIWAGPHHLHYTALPSWASTLGMLFSVMLWMPSWGGGINGLLTLRGAWHKLRDDPVLKFFVAGVTFYMMSTFEGPMLSVKSVNALSHYTDWTIAHVHSGALGWNGLMTFGMMYWLLPRLFQTRLWSTKLAEYHFWAATLGILLYIIPIYFGGITQGLMWRAFDEVGQLKYPDFVETVMRLMPYYWIRVVGGSIFILGALLGAVNFFMTWRSRPAVYEEVVHEAPRLSRSYPEATPPPTRLTGNVEFGKRLEVWITMWWHRVWERRPIKFTVFVVIAVAVASLFEIIPMFLIRSNVPTIESVRPYTPLELAGRDIYVAEGCYNCHSQMIRPIYAEVKRYGEYSKPGEFVYDHPFQWGSRRIGPDLAREGGRQSNAWHALHFEDPRQVTENSTMPAYPWLLGQDLDFASIQSRVRAMAMLGVPYGEAVKDGVAERMARAQAAEIAASIAAQGGKPGLEGKKVTALIAYMQRLGRDATNPAPAEGGAP
ncbi:MAG: cytochrome-c oxidase, cbb3-type subunit I [Phycisphaeraceae bacterium]|nr:MAG: cytochrome-c oxidase, cbb3-type subunit I [Phycisphaeraceae bacterium]